MSPRWFRRLADGLSTSRECIEGRLNLILSRNPGLDATFWGELEDTLILADVGVTASREILDRLRAVAVREAIVDAEAVVARLAHVVADVVDVKSSDPFASVPATVLVVGVNGTGKTTTVGKLAHEGIGRGLSVLLGAADTYRAAAVEQLLIWADRAGVPVVMRERGADPASVVFDTIARSNAARPDLTLIDTAGRLHTSSDLMRELQKVHRIAVRESVAPVSVVLVMDATTGQNGLSQVREFDEALDLHAIILTKLDGTARGGIAVAIARETRLPIVRVGVGEGIDDLHPFSADEYARALVGKG